MNRIEEHTTPTVLQQAIGEPLRSEQRTTAFLPRVLSSIDMLVIFIAIVLFIPDSTVVQVTQQAGGSAYLYWLIGAVTFLLPGAIVTSQLNRFLPAEGSIYVWTHRAFGPLWGFFAGFCAWFPGVLVMLSTGEFALALVQSIGQQISHSKASWLNDTWQQGIFIFLFLILAGWLSTLSVRTIMNIAKWVILCYGVAILAVGLAGVLWLLGGHAPQTAFSLGQSTPSTQNLSLYGVIVLALLGIEVPLNMVAETKQSGKRPAASFYLRWGALLVLIAYLIDTFGVMTVVSQSSTNPAYATLAAIGIVFGVPVSVLFGLVFIAFFLISTVIFNIAFARILFVSALDQRLPSTLARVNRRGSPSFATNLQTVIVLLLTVLLYFILPFLYPKEGLDFSARVENVTDAATTIIWCISMVILFIDLPILLYRFHSLLTKRRGQLLAPPWVLYLCCTVGAGGSAVGIWATVSSSWNSALMPDPYWGIIVGGVVLLLLFIGLVGSAYPRLLGSLNEQTALARENAHLYSDLRTAYEKLNQLDQLKDAFLATASHELRTPLTVVQGYLDLLTEMPEELTTSAIRRSFLHKAQRACNELVLLQANIMDASTIESDMVKLHCSNLLLKDITEAIMDLFEPLILQQRRTIEIDMPKDITVWADETRLKQILRNLVTNAFRYAPQCTPIRITAHVNQEEHKVSINVIDYGLGIPPDKQELIFERFVRLERDAVGDIRGSGLGLAICRQLVEAMHGTLTVQSSGIKGEGSTFTFTLPIGMESSIPHQ